MQPVRFGRSMRRMRQLMEGITDSDSDADVVDGHLALAPHLGHVRQLNSGWCGLLVGCCNYLSGLGPDGALFTQEYEQRFGAEPFSGEARMKINI
jgi:hypothetical protein